MPPPTATENSPARRLGINQRAGYRARLVGVVLLGHRDSGRVCPVCGGLRRLRVCRPSRLWLLRPRWCCLPGDKKSAADAAVARDAARDAAARDAARDAARYAGGAAAGAVAAAAAAAYSESRGPSRPLREAVFYPVPQGPSSPATSAEAAGDWRLAAALRVSSAAAPTNDIERRAARLERGRVGAQESK